MGRTTADKLMIFISFPIVMVSLQGVLLQLPVHVFAGQLHVQGRGLEGGVAEDLLHDPQLGAALGCRT